MQRRVLRNPWELEKAWATREKCLKILFPHQTLGKISRISNSMTHFQGPIPVPSKSLEVSDIFSWEASHSWGWNHRLKMHQPMVFLAGLGPRCFGIQIRLRPKKSQKPSKKSHISKPPGPKAARKIITPLKIHMKPRSHEGLVFDAFPDFKYSEHLRFQPLDWGVPERSLQQKKHNLNPTWVVESSSYYSWTDHSSEKKCDLQTGSWNPNFSGWKLRNIRENIKHIWVASNSSNQNQKKTTSKWWWTIPCWYPIILRKKITQQK